MNKLLEHNRRPDISFSRKRGIIRITARLARTLALQPGDAINIAVSEGEFLLYAIHISNDIGRFEAQCRPTNKRGGNFCANCVRLCRTLLDSVGVQADKASFMVGQAFDRQDTTYVPIITLNPIL